MGVSVNATNATVIANRISGNLVGIFTLGEGHSAHFNEIIANGTGAVDQGFLFFLDADNNWWGCNEGPGQPGCDTTSGPVAANTWLVLDFQATPDSIPGGGTSDLIATLTKNSDGLDTSGSGTVPDGITVQFETTLGSVGSPSVSKFTTDGIAQATLTADQGPGLADLTATAWAESVFDVVTITSAPPTPTPSPTPTPIPTPSPPPTPTSTPPPTDDLLQGDNNCDGIIQASDALTGLRHLAGFSVNQPPGCPTLGGAVPAAAPAGAPPALFGDVDCDGDVDSVDQLKILRKVAAFSVSQSEPCTDIAEPF